MTSDRPRVAIHEAGHAAVALHLGFRLGDTDIIPDAYGAGICRVHYDTPRSRAYAERVMMMKLAGYAAVQRRYGDCRTWGDAAAGSDAEGALELARQWEEAEGPCPHCYLDLLLRRTEALLRRPALWAAVEAIAGGLLARGTLTGQEVRRLYRDAQESVSYQERLAEEVFGG